MIILTDIHGCYLTMLALIQKAKEKYPHKDIVIAGDLVDRGPRSREVVQYCIDNNILVVKGNHEDMFVKQPFIWGYNGGIECLDSYKLENGELDKETLSKHRAWVDALPLILEFEDLKDEKGRYLVVSHSCITHIYDNKDEHGFASEVMWNRSYSFWQEDRDDIYNVFGHTPVIEPYQKEGFIDIDTGCCFGKRLTAFIFPEKEIISQEYID